MKKFLSRFSPRYSRSLVYMLQASEYDTRAYLHWVFRAQDFANVEVRKSIDWTKKAKFLFGGLWGVSSLFILGWFVSFVFVRFSTGLFIGVALMIVNAYFLPYALALLNVMGHFVQRPIEERRIASAKTKLKAHSAFKIAIAGSFGKTSMREILKVVLAEGKKVVAPPGSYNTPLGIASFIESLSGDEEVLLFECGEYYPGDIKKLCEFVEPDLGIITGVNEAHLEKFGTLEWTTSTIFELADYLGDKTLYVNAENAAANERAKAEAVRYSRGGVADWKIERVESSLEGTSFIMRNRELAISAHSKLLGAHMVGPLAAASHIALMLGLSVQQIEAGIANTKAFSHRLEPHTDPTGVVTLDDSYNGNPDGARAVIEFLGSLKGNRRFYVTPGLVEMGSRSEAVHREIGRGLAAAQIEKVVLIRTSVAPFIEAGLLAAGYEGDIIWFEDMPKAITALAHMTVAGDVVLIQNDWPDQYA